MNVTQVSSPVVTLDGITMGVVIATMARVKPI
jgi:hypothetical protein